MLGILLVRQSVAWKPQLVALWQNVPAHFVTSFENSSSLTSDSGTVLVLMCEVDMFDQ